MVWLCRACVIAVLVAQFGGSSEIGSPWADMAFLYLSALAIGLDALWTGVRKRAESGPSIANLGPGGWAIFTCLFWVLAVPAYIVAALRHVTGREPEGVREPIDTTTWVALGALVAMTLVLACFAGMAQRG